MLGDYVSKVLLGETVPINNDINYHISFSTGEAYSLDVQGEVDNQTKLPAVISINMIDDNIYNKYLFGTIKKGKDIEYDEIYGSRFSENLAYYIEINIKKSDLTKYMEILSSNNIHISAFGEISVENGKGVIESFTLCNIPTKQMLSEKELKEYFSECVADEHSISSSQAIFQENMQIYQKETTKAINLLNKYILIIVVSLIILLLK